MPFNEDELQKSYPIPISNPLKILSNPLESSPTPKIIGENNKDGLIIRPFPLAGIKKKCNFAADLSETMGKAPCGRPCV